MINNNVELSYKEKNMTAKIYDFEYYYKKKQADNIAQSIVDTINNAPCDVIKIKKYFKQWMEVKTELAKRNIA